jgi:rod shape-determining protein MreC
VSGSADERVVTERRTRVLFVLALVAQLVLLTLRSTERNRPASPLERVGLGLVAPFARLVDRSADSASGLRQRLRRRAELEEENARLRAELEALRIERMRGADYQDEARRLAQALDYSRDLAATFHLADVIFVDHSSWLRTLVVDAGGYRPHENQPVVSPLGLVGRVVVAAGRYAKVQLITDRAAAVGAMLERTRRQGVARGDGEGGLELDYVPVQADVAVGDRVVTAGIDGVFPRGLAVGRVVRVEPGGELFHRIRLQPAVDLSRLDQTYLLERTPVPEAMKEERPIARN